MKSFKIKDRIFKLSDIKRFYTAVVIKSGYGDEVTEISFKWFDSEGKGRVEPIGFGIFIITKDEHKYQFLVLTQERS